MDDNRIFIFMIFFIVLVFIFLGLIGGTLNYATKTFRTYQLMGECVKMEHPSDACKDIINQYKQDAK
jgi:hypothetical protein